MDPPIPQELVKIDEEIEFISRILSRTPDHPNMRPLLSCLGNAHEKRFDLQGEPDDLNKAIECLSFVLSLAPDDDPGLRQLLEALGVAHSKRFQHLGDMDDMGMAIKLMSNALAMISDDHPDLPQYLSNLAMSHKCRFAHLGELSDIEISIEYDTRAVAATPKDHPVLAENLAKLGTSHHCRFERLGELNDLEKAIECQSHALAIASTDCSFLPAMLANLASSHNYRFQRLGGMDDLGKAIEYQSQALASTPDSHPDLPIHLVNLSASYSDRFERLGRLNDLEKAMEYQARALPLTTEDHPDLPNRLSALGASHFHRFRRLGQLDDLENAIGYQSRALVLTPENHPRLPNLLANQGTYYGDRFKRLGELDGLEKAIEYKSRALALTPDNHPDLPTWLVNLGASHGSRFQRLGDLDDLSNAMKYFSRALVLIPDGHPDLRRCLSNLGSSYNHRFRRLGELDDLEKALEYESRALALTPDDHPDLPKCLTSLGTSHNHRFERLTEPGDVENAIRYETRALELTPDGHPDLPDRLNSLGASYSSRFQHLGKLDDLDKAVEYHSRALEVTPDGHPDLLRQLANIGLCHANRFKNLGVLDDLKKAIEYAARALAITHEDHPDLCRWYSIHALSYLLYYRHSKNLFYLQQSLHLLRTASASPAGSPRDRFINACEWAAYASEDGALDPIEAYQTAIDLLPHFIWLGTSTRQRYQDLKTIATLAVDAAHAAIRSANYSLALEWLEHTRCVVWHQTLALRSPLDRLKASHPSLASRLQRVADELHSASLISREPQPLPFDSTSSEELGQRRRSLAKEYTELLVQARALPGFTNFLQPMKANGLARAARSGPIVVINCHEQQCDALLVLPGQTTVTHLGLTNFNRKRALAVRLKIESSLNRLGLRERGVRTRREPGAKEDFASALKIIWDDIVKPVLESLGYMVKKLSGELPHITWCPTGPVSFLPLHAAGDYDQPGGGAKIFEYVISSYTPTLTALLATTVSRLSSESRVVAIGQAATPGHKPLPGTTTELGYVECQVKGGVGYSQFVDAEATPSIVLDAMEQHDWVHLACHAHQNIRDPTKSGFFLHGDTEGTEAILDLTTINRRSLKNKGLAFLSACQTATGDETVPDEAVHLASGMLVAGYSSVIATMWSVVDQDAPIVANKVYGQLMTGGTLGSGEAGTALYDAVAGLREKVGEKEFGRWVPYIHIGS